MVKTKLLPQESPNEQTERNTAKDFSKVLKYKKFVGYFWLGNMQINGDQVNPFKTNQKKGKIIKYATNRAK